MTLNLIEGVEIGHSRLEPSRLENSLILSTEPNPSPPKMDGVRKDLTACTLGVKEPLEFSGLFNQGDPDLSSCMPADDIIETESDQLLTVDVAELFPDLLALNEASSMDDNIKPPAVDALDLGSLVQTEKSDEEVSPAETDASLDHFFNTFTDLTGFLENFSAETGPSDLADNSAALSGIDITTNDSTTAPSVGDLGTSPDNVETEPTDDEPPVKRACQSTGKSSGRTRQTYRERRDKNNVASRRSRAARKHKFSTMETQVINLEKDNEHLKKKIEELQKIAEMSRKCLVNALSKK